MDLQQQQILDDELARLSALGCFQRLPLEDIARAVVTYFFLVPKKDNKWRAVIDLTYSNSYSPKIHFKMEGIKEVRDLIRLLDFMITIDLKDAYLHLFFNKDSRKFAAFSHRGVLFQCISMLFGVTHGPRWWTKVLRPVVKYFRSLGIRCVIYIDDIIFFLGQDFAKACEETDFIINTILKLGLSINLKKSIIKPTQRVEFLGFIVDSRILKLFAPDHKLKDTKKSAKSLFKKGSCSVRVLASLLGKISAVAQAVLPWRLCSRALLLNKNRVLKATKNWESVVHLSRESLDELLFWTNKVQEFNGRNILSLEPDWITVSDSSQKSFAGMEIQPQSNDPFILVEDWNLELQEMHNNFLETLASTETIKNFILQRDLRDGILLHKVDNTTAVSYLSKQGGRFPHISAPVQELWHLCLDRHIELRSAHIPGQEVLKDADFLSRMKDKQSEWSLPIQVFQILQDLWGPFPVDCFATQFNTHLQQFYSWWKDPKALAWDAMTQPWPNNSYLFPPFILLGWILKRIQLEKLRVILITPHWEGAAWWPVIMQLAVEVPLVLPAVLMDLDQKPQQLKWNLLGWKLSGVPLESLTSQTRSSKWLTEVGGQVRLLIPTGSFSQIGVDLRI